MTKSEILELQRSLNHSGFSNQILNEPLDEDGIYGPNTDRVYRAKLDQDQSFPTVTPEPAKPWWASRALLGILASLLAGAAHQFGWSVDDGAVTDVLIKLVEVGGLVVATWGTMNRKAAIDPTLVARAGNRELRLPTYVSNDPRGAFKDS